MSNILREPENEKVVPQPAVQETKSGQILEETEILQVRISTPSIEDDEYTLEAFGDISLSNIDFVPPPPSTISPQKVASYQERDCSMPQEHMASRYGSIRVCQIPSAFSACETDS